MPMLDSNFSIANQWHSLSDTSHSCLSICFQRRRTSFSLVKNLLCTLIFISGVVHSPAFLPFRWIALNFSTLPLPLFSASGRVEGLVF